MPSETASAYKPGDSELNGALIDESTAFEHLNAAKYSSQSRGTRNLYDQLTLIYFDDVLN